jgi:hypothetical protein
LVASYCTQQGIDIPGLPPIDLGEEFRGSWQRKFIKGEIWKEDCYLDIWAGAAFTGTISELTAHCSLYLTFIREYLKSLGLTHIGSHPFEDDYQWVQGKLTRDTLAALPEVSQETCRCGQ